jgi:hypothetical protein
LDETTQSGIDVKRAFSERRPAHEEWSADEKEMFKAVCGEGMQTLGYEVPF